MLGMQRHNQTGELLPRPEKRASLLLLRFYAVVALWHRGFVLREFSVSTSLAMTYIRFTMQRFGPHRTDSGCSLPAIWNHLENLKHLLERSDAKAIKTKGSAFIHCDCAATPANSVELARSS